MSTKVTLKTSTGRAKCAICKRKIEVGQKQISFESYNSSAQVHSSPYDCPEGRF